MYNPKKEVYAILSSLGYACSQGYQANFKKVPAITFTIGSNRPKYSLGKEIVASEVEVVVDIWANESATLSRIASEAEAAMREHDYLQTFSTDVPAPAGCLYHYQMRFGGIKPDERN